jgi:hypothetical protein
MFEESETVQIEFGKNTVSMPRKAYPQLMKPLNMGQLGAKPRKSNAKPASHREYPPRHNSIDCQKQKLSKINPTLSNQHFFTRQNSKEKHHLDPGHSNQNRDQRSVHSGSVLPDGEQNSDYEPLRNLNSFLKTRKFKAENPEFQKTFIQVYQASQIMQTKIKNLYAEIRRLETLNKYLFLSQRHKEDMLSKILEENRKISEDLESIKLQLHNNQTYHQPNPATNTHQSLQKSQILQPNSQKNMLSQSVRSFKVNSHRLLTMGKKVRGRGRGTVSVCDKCRRDGAGDGVGVFGGVGLGSCNGGDWGKGNCLLVRQQLDAILQTSSLSSL